jgi:hypothetical protein
MQAIVNYFINPYMLVSKQQLSVNSAVAVSTDNPLRTVLYTVNTVLQVVLVHTRKAYLNLDVDYPD